MSDRLTALGVFSRPDRAGVDLALIETDGDEAIGLSAVRHLAHGPTHHAPFHRDLKASLVRAEKAALEGREGSADIGKAGGEITSAFIVAIENFLERERIKRKDIDVIGLGGHSIFHRSSTGDAIGRSWRLGDGATIALETRIDVVSDFAIGDLSAGGRGVPLAPVYYRALIASMRDRPQCAVGVVSLDASAIAIAYVPENASASDLLAYDSGPGLRYIDEWKSLRKVKAGEVEVGYGAADEEALRLLLLNSYLRRPPPKFIDQYRFKRDHLVRLRPEIGRATLAAFIADCIERSEHFLPEPPGGYIVCGEGRKREALISVLHDRLDAEIASAEDAGWRGDDMEAECCAFLAVRSLKRLPLSYPNTTRVSAPTRGGVHHRAPV